jgi:hypothetical protein
MPRPKHKPGRPEKSFVDEKGDGLDWVITTLWVIVMICFIVLFLLISLAF